MKKLLCISLTLISTLVAQNFSGTITYSLTDTGEVREVFGPYMPSKIKVAVLNDNVNEDFEGGILDIARYSFIKGKPEVTIIVDTAKLYNTVKLEQPLKKVITKLDETETIMGHVCTRYKVSVDEPGNKYDYHIWAALDMPMVASAILTEYGGEYFLDQVPYAILKVENLAGLHYEATHISTLPPDPNLFKIPKGYKLEKKMFRKVEEKE